MAQYTAFEMWAASVAAFLGENDPILFQEDDMRPGLVSGISLSSGFPADLIHSSDSGAHVNALVESEGVGHPHEVFVHAGDLATLTGCSLETGRNYLEKFADKGLLRRHGDGTIQHDGEGYDTVLYLPVREDPKKTMRALYELERGTFPDSLGDLETVTPGQFDHVEDGIYAYRHDAEVSIDVSEPTDRNVVLQEYVMEQLHEHGLTPTSPKNFVYQLRKKADLV